MLTNAVAPDKLGGLERYVRELSAALVRRGADVTVVTKRMSGDDAPEETGDDGVRIRRHAVPDKRNPAFAALYPVRVASAVRAVLADVPDAVVHGHYAITTLAAAAAGRRYVYTFHAPVHREMLSERQDSYLLPGAVQTGAVAALRATEAYVIRRAAAVVTLSRYSTAELSGLSAVGAARAVTLPGGVDTGFFAPGADGRHPWPEASPLLVAARRLTARTGVAELVAAVPAVAAHHPGMGLAIAGDGGLRAEIAALVARTAPDGPVRLLGRVDDADLRRWYRAADLAVTPTQRLEGFGLATAEAMACGTPAWVTPVGANPELVAGLDPVLLGGGTAPADVSAGLLAALADPDRLAALRSTVRAHVHPRWSWDAVADRYLELYDHVAGLREDRHRPAPGHRQHDGTQPGRHREQDGTVNRTAP
jgi:glycosyltransferase involved in cell wall biosynthesis